MDDVTALQAVTDSVLALDVELFVPRDAVLWKNDIRLSRSVTGHKNWVGENAPEGTAIQYHLGSAAENVTLHILDAVTRDTVRNLEATVEAGLNRVQWDLRANPEDEDQTRGARVDPGTYLVELVVDGEEQRTKVDVLEDVWMM